MRSFCKAIPEWERKKETLLEKEPEGYRNLVVHQNYKLVYYVEGNTIYIVDLWDTRREPRLQADNTK